MNNQGSRQVPTDEKSKTFPTPAPSRINVVYTHQEFKRPMETSHEPIGFSSSTIRPSLPQQRPKKGLAMTRLRISNVIEIASDVFRSCSAAYDYLHTPNFSLGGAAPIELLDTAEGEQIVLSELQTQAAGGPI
jgi:uncharacterized protein (DUF2384 family)